MKIEYKVFSADNGKSITTVKLPSGQEVDAPVDSFEVQLTPVDSDTHGTVKVAFINPVEIAEAKALFVPEKTVFVTITE